MSTVTPPVPWAQPQVLSTATYQTPAGPVVAETDTRGDVTLVYDAELPHPSGQKVKQTFRKFIGNPAADPGKVYNDPFGMVVFHLLRENDALRVRLQEAEKTRGKKG